MLRCNILALQTHFKPHNIEQFSAMHRTQDIFLNSSEDALWENTSQMFLTFVWTSPASPPVKCLSEWAHVRSAGCQEQFNTWTHNKTELTQQNLNVMSRLLLLPPGSSPHLHVVDTLFLHSSYMWNSGKHQDQILWSFSRDHVSNRLMCTNNFMQNNICIIIIIHIYKKNRECSSNLFLFVYIFLLLQTKNSYSLRDKKGRNKRRYTPSERPSYSIKPTVF